jgi:hypothetical protein
MSRWRKQNATIFPPAGVVFDGHETLIVASRFGVVRLKRQVCYYPAEGVHRMPSNQWLPVHSGKLITRGLQEWACLLSNELSFGVATRLLGWFTQEPEILSENTLRRVVCRHGELISRSYEAEVEALCQAPDLSRYQPELVTVSEGRRAASWPSELSQAVELALTQPQVRAPEGVAPADWERVLTARAQEPDLGLEALRRLGPALATGQVLASVDEVLTRKPTKRCFWEQRSARILTPHGMRYLVGHGESFLQLCVLFLLLCSPRTQALLLLGDGARWIRDLFLLLQRQRPTATLLLDWYHLRHKCADFASMICPGKAAKAAFLGTLYRLLWHGQSAEAVAFLQGYRPLAKNPEKLEELSGYLQARQPYLVNYRQRYRDRLYIGSGQAEKANDLIVARRQKHQGMHWSQQTSQALAALKTLLLNDAWDRYWSHHQLLPLARLAA